MIYSSADIPGLIPDLALCRTSVVEKRPKDIQKLVDTWFDVIAFLKAQSGRGGGDHGQGRGAAARRVQGVHAGHASSSTCR